MSGKHVVIIGAGPAGLACASCLKSDGHMVTVLEKADQLANSWRNHYDRLHLHTDRGHSGLPGLPMPRTYPRYPSREQVVTYLENYALHFGIEPEFGVTVRAVRTDGQGWRVETSGAEYDADAVIFATGIASNPVLPNWPGLDEFEGEILHSSSYRNPQPFSGKSVLVVGFGNSGGEIALDCAEAGLDITISVRSPVRLLPRELLGLPILTWSIAQQYLPYKLVDALNAPVLRLAVGKPENYGLVSSAKGPMAMVREDGRIPLIDIGTLNAIRDGRITVRPGIKRFENNGAVFEDGTRSQFDILILATGYRPDLRDMLPGSDDVLDPTGFPSTCGKQTGKPGLFFCGYVTSPTGQIREIGIEAKRIAKMV